MNKYEQHAEMELDLHGCTTLESERALNDVLKEAKYKHIRIIIGKGTHSENGPVLPIFVRNYLNARGLKHRPAKLKDGGEGALEVFL